MSATGMPGGHLAAAFVNGILVSAPVLDF